MKTESIRTDHESSAPEPEKTKAHYLATFAARRRSQDNNLQRLAAARDKKQRSTPSV
jgi:hypothetical protein